MSNGGGIGRAEGFVHYRQEEGADTDKRVAGYLPQEDEHEPAANKGSELNIIEAELIGKFAAEDAATNSTGAKYGHYQGCLTDGAVLGFCEVEGHEGDNHGAGTIDEHYQREPPGSGRQTFVRIFI